FTPRKAGCCCGIFACLQNQAPHSPSCPRRMNEERSNFCRIHPRIEQLVLTPRPMIAAVERLALAPAATSSNRGAVNLLRLGNEIRAVGDQLAVDSQTPLPAHSRFV